MQRGYCWSMMKDICRGPLDICQQRCLWTALDLLKPKDMSNSFTCLQLEQIQTCSCYLTLKLYVRMCLAMLWIDFVTGGAHAC